jgi:hypothetical protein
VLSAILFVYFVGYTIRILVGVFRVSRHSQSNSDRTRKQSSLRLLFHMHEPNKRHFLNALYLPVLLVRNQLFSVFMVVLSSSPVSQIVICLLLLVAYSIYSFMYCPYNTRIKACLHVSEVVFILQLVVLLISILSEYGAEYSIQVLNGSGNQYRSAWILLSLNFLQILAFTILALFILFDLVKKTLCKNKSNKL